MIGEPAPILDIGLDGCADFAEQLLRDAIAAGEAVQGRNHPMVVMRLNNLASLLRNKGSLAEAETLFREVIVSNAQTLGRDHPDFAVGLNNLGNLLRDRGEHQEAEPLYRLSLTVLERSWGPTQPELAILLADYSRLFRKLDRKDEARRLDSRVRELDAGSHRGNLAVDWRDLQKTAKNVSYAPR